MGSDGDFFDPAEFLESGRDRRNSLWSSDGGHFEVFNMG